MQSLDPERVHGVLHMLYLLFNEGYSSAQPDRVIRRELCDEALRLRSAELAAWLLLVGSTLGELHRRCGHCDRALAHTKRALAAAPTNAEKSLLERRTKRICKDALERA